VFSLQFLVLRERRRVLFIVFGFVAATQVLRFKRRVLFAISGFEAVTWCGDWGFDWGVRLPAWASTVL